MPIYDWCQTKEEEDDMQPEVHGFFHADTNTISYVVKDPGSNACAVIDSVLDYDPASGRTSTVFADQIVDYVKSRKLKVEWILETHAHADHLSAAPYIKQRLGGKTAIGSNITTVQNVFGKVFNAGPEFRSDGSQFDALLSDGDEVLVGGLRGRVMYTPGHTPACITYVFGDAAFIGDTLFMPDYGTSRCDFPGGDAHQLYKSVQKILSLPPQTRLFLCHDYLPPGRTEYRWETTVAEQKAHNVQIHEGVSEDQFVTLRKARDATLKMPVLILPSVQVNIRAGELPPAEDNGINYLKIPVNVL
jgi:glyoxylase-like metal-dependent hydrolase (beta-lactamase superfamily II)